MTSTDNSHEFRSALDENQFCGGVVFKASPSRRQVKAVIFERGEDGEPTVTVIMTRDETNSAASSGSSGAQAGPETETFVSSTRNDQTFKIRSVQDDAGSNV